MAVVYFCLYALYLLCCVHVCVCVSRDKNTSMAKLWNVTHTAIATPFCKNDPVSLADAIATGQVCSNLLFVLFNGGCT